MIIMKSFSKKRWTLVILTVAILACCCLPVMAEEKTLRIATTNEVKSPAFIGDYTLVSLTISQILLLCR